MRRLSWWTPRWALHAAVVTAVGGAALVAVGVAAQEHAPAPSAAVAGRIAPVAPVAPRSTAPAPGLSRSAPVALSVPALGIRGAPLQRLGENPDGTVQVPTSYQVAGWFTGSVTPGQLGPMVILGHVDSYRGPGVFFRLGALRPGDTVSVERADGRTVTYLITGVRQYRKAAFPTAAVYANTPVPTIRLVTCGGAFDPATRHYLSNVVVFGQQVGSG